MKTNFNETFLRLLSRDNTLDSDLERKVFFLIMAGNEDLSDKINHFYDFEERSIKPESLEENVVDLCSSSLKLVTLAFNLFNGYPADIFETFSVLDDENLSLAIAAIKLRFSV